MRPIDIFRGMNPPCHRFNPYMNLEYQTAFCATNIAIRELAKFDVTEEIVNRSDTIHNALSTIEMDLMWCLAFAERIVFQKSFGVSTKDSFLNKFRKHRDDHSCQFYLLLHRKHG